MITRIARNHLPARSLTDSHRILPCQFDGAFHGLRAAGHEEDFLHPRWRKGRDLGRKPFAGFGFEMQPVAEGGFLHLPPHGVEHARIGMADIADHRAGRAVEIALAINIPHIDTAGFGQHRPSRTRLVKQMAFRFHECASTGNAAQSFSRKRKTTLAPIRKG